MMDLAIISFEHVHAPHYLECLPKIDGVRLKAVAEPDSERLLPYSSSLPGVTIYRDFREMLKAEILDGVIVCAANARHKEIVIECARFRKAILCEKPIATRVADAREMLAICQAHEVLLGICFPARFSEATQRAKQLIRQNSLGRVVAVKTTNHGIMPGGWFGDPQLAGGGAVMDHTVHVVDVLRWLFDAEFTRVFAHTATRFYDLQVEDCGLLSLEMNNEVIATLDASWSRPNHSFPIWGDLSLTLVGTEGILNLELFPWTLNFYSEKAGKHITFSHDGDLNRMMLENFVAAIRKEVPISANGVDGLRALEVVEAAYRSSASNSAVTL